MIPGYRTQHTPFIVLPAEHALCVPSTQTDESQLIKKKGNGEEMSMEEELRNNSV